MNDTLSLILRDCLPDSTGQNGADGANLADQKVWSVAEAAVFLDKSIQDLKAELKVGLTLNLNQFIRRIGIVLFSLGPGLGGGGIIS